MTGALLGKLSMVEEAEELDMDRMWVCGYVTKTFDYHCQARVLMFMIHQICMSLLISYVSFTEFLWGFTFTFIGPFSYLCGMGKYRTIILRIRQFLLKRDLMKPMDCDYKESCATLLLEQTQAIR